MFKKIYIEITNICNLNCHFCIGHHRHQEFMSMNNFQELINKLKNHTKYLYFHVMGEPLLHPKINDFINLASNDFQINITTNGYLIKKIENNKNVRQLNISLHDFDPSGNLELDVYLTNIFSSIEKLIENNTIINLRMWSNSPYKEEIIKYINNQYQVNIEINGKEKIKDKLYFEEETEFIWPSLNNNFTCAIGTCYGTRTHIGVLVDGTVVPCCLDSEGIINLGNIYKSELSDIIRTEKFINMKNSFQNNKKIETLCQKCSFKRNNG